MKQTIKQQYQVNKFLLEDYCREGMAVKQMAVKFKVSPVKMSNIIKTLDISVMRLRNEGYNNVNK